MFFYYLRLLKYLKLLVEQVILILKFLDKSFVNLGLILLDLVTIFCQKLAFTGLECF